MAELKRESIFQLEQDMVDLAVALPPTASLEEVRQQLDTLTRAYSKLLRQTEKITKVGDSIQRKLVRARMEIAEKNRRLEVAQKNHVHKEKMMAMSTLVQGLAHELGNPLNFVTNFATINAELCTELQNLVGEGKTVDMQTLSSHIDDLLHGAQIIVEQGRRAASIVESMGHLSNRKQIRVGSQREEDLNYLLTHFGVSVARQFQHQLVGPLTLQEHFAQLPPILVVMADLGTVFTQLITNAFEALIKRQRHDRSFQPTVRLTTQIEGNQIQVLVEDNGCGVDPEIQDKIFTPFFSDKNSAANIGLGLSTSYDIIAQGYDGDLRMSVAPDGFTRFSVSLPVSRDASPGTHSPDAG